MDAHQLPDAKGLTALHRHLLGEGAAERQQRRDEVLATSAADFLAFADVLDAVRDHGTAVVVASQSAVDSAAAVRAAGGADAAAVPAFDARRLL